MARAGDSPTASVWTAVQRGVPRASSRRERRPPSTAPSSASSRIPRSSRRRVSFDTLSNRLRELAFLNKGLKIVIEDDARRATHTFLYKGGIIEFIKAPEPEQDARPSEGALLRGKKDNIEVEVGTASTTTATRRASSPSPTTSTRAKAAHT